MTIPATTRRGCSPWAFLGCGCGFLGALGILFVFLLLGVRMHAVAGQPAWNAADFERCEHNLAYLARALASYRADHHGRLPASLEELTARYLLSPDVLRCPLYARGIGAAYAYTPAGADPRAPLLTCSNHQHGRLILLHNGRIRLPSGWGGRRPRPTPPTEGSYDPAAP